MGISVSPVPSLFGKLRIALAGEPTASNRRDGVGGLTCRGSNSRCVICRRYLASTKRKKACQLSLPIPVSSPKSTYSPFLRAVNKR